MPTSALFRYHLLPVVCNTVMMTHLGLKVSDDIIRSTKAGPAIGSLSEAPSSRNEHLGRARFVFVDVTQYILG